MVSITFLQAVLLSAILAVLGLAYVVWHASRRRWGDLGLPRGDVVYEDTSGWQRCRTLRAPRYGLAGRPDYVVRTGRQTIPVEVKPGRRASSPYDSDVMQLAAYCLLVERDLGRRPTYGLLRYEGRTFRIPYDRRLRRALLGTLQAMAGDLAKGDVARSHDEPVRCRFCGFRSQCDQSLVD